MGWPVYRPGRKPELGFPRKKKKKKKKGWFGFSDGLIGRSHAGAAEWQTEGRGAGRGGGWGGGVKHSAPNDWSLCLGADH